MLDDKADWRERILGALRDLKQDQGRLNAEATPASQRSPREQRTERAAVAS